MKKVGEHGLRFVYLTPNTDVLAWLMKRLLNQSLAEIMHERIWSKLGVERDAFWIVDPATTEKHQAPVCSLHCGIRLVLDRCYCKKGSFNGKQIIPTAVVEDIEQGGDQDAFARGQQQVP